MRLILSVMTLIFTFHAMGKTAYDFDLLDTRGQKVESSNLKGKVTMFVNIATRCGYTGQLGDLEKLYQKYKDKGFTIVGIPSNDFGEQTPEKGEDINKFCRLKYGTSFPILRKTPVKGQGKHPLITFLIADKKEIAWNFEKFLVDKNGRLIERFSSSVEPMSDQLTKVIEKQL